MRLAVILSLAALTACGSDNPPGADALWRVQCGSAPGCTQASEPVDILAFDGQDGNTVRCTFTEGGDGTTTDFNFFLRAANAQSMSIRVLLGADGAVVGTSGFIEVTDIVNGEQNRLRGNIGGGDITDDQPCTMSPVLAPAEDRPEGPSREFEVECRGISNAAAPDFTARDVTFPSNTRLPATITVFNCDGF
ncbi:MAG: hypothetical protein AAF411_10695 [Myxococcota bacterium]